MVTPTNVYVISAFLLPHPQKTTTPIKVPIPIIQSTDFYRKFVPFLGNHLNNDFLLFI